MNVPAGGKERSRKKSGQTAKNARLLQWFSTVRFRRKWFGGVDEADVWKQLSVLHQLYEKELQSQKAYYEGKLSAYRQMEDRR